MPPPQRWRDIGGRSAGLPASVEELDIRAPFHQVFYFWEYYQDTGGGDTRGG